ncbi:T9SS type A sorting domain-containing protein [Panacibacter ginsenosidivorans]|uniref:T9SS type A sorting domain-containing protein n=1 Tax=Panacibacter ginsenosidivorans TaxID=1813871 RepID=A0A5B8VAJ3_9BACT|nr:T9SS type A sorting domain-containing protein [Panacibacter ginsenosidivorans]QEC68464.1 T9SS type A sorting domain-containing protein [Panacibacter ginsenosidivorans]
MKNRVVCLCAIILTLMSVPVFSQVTDLSKTKYGIWQTYGDPVSSTINPEIRGRLCNFKWAKLEIAPDKWDWKEFDYNLALRAADSLPLIFMVFTEEDAPEWLYSNGVPKVAEKDNRGNVIAYCPFYEDPNYKFYFKRMIQRVREHVETLPSNVRNQVLAVQACFGSTGDYISYKGDVDRQYRITNAGFYALFQEFSQAYYDEYRNTNPKIYVLSNPKNNGPDQALWLLSNCPGGWLKAGSIGKGYQLNDEGSKAEWLYPILNQQIAGEYIRARSEITGGATKSAWWTKAPAMNMFALMCYDIYWGLDWNNQGYEQIGNKVYDSAYGFFNKYAGEKDPSKSAHALCALRDGLDASDAVRFPENLYGKAVRGNPNRYTKIANEFASHGAKLEDVHSAMNDEISNLGAKGINDVGWDIFPGNYERYLHQIKANETSVGYWNVQSANKNDMYGRFARGFDLAKGKNALYFNVEDAFFNDVPLDSKQPVVIEIIYFDNSYGSWELFYDGAVNTDQSSIQVTGTNTNSWKRASVTINDAYFGNRAKNGADFYIKSTGTEDVIFSTVELKRPNVGEVAGFSASSLKPFSPMCIQGSAYQTLYVSGSFLPQGNTIIGPLNGFAFSIDSGKTYPDSVIIKDRGAVFSEKVFVKFKPIKEGVYNGNIPVRGDNVPTYNVLVEATSVNSSPTLQPVVKSISCFGTKDGAIDLVSSGGEGPFTYNWSGTSNFKATTKDVSGLAAGTYTVSVNSLGGCLTKTTVQITSPTALQVTAEASQISVDQNTTMVTVSATGGTSPYLGVGSFSAGEGTYTYTVTDANGCNSNTVLTVTKSKSSLKAFASSQNISCHGGFTTVSVTATGGTEPYSGTGNFIVAAGTYTYTVTDADGTNSSITITVNEPPAFSAIVTTEKIMCNGGTTNIDVSGTGGVTPYSGIGNFTVNAGIYTYTLTDGNGCTAVKTINIIEPAQKLNVSLSADPILCNSSTTNIVVSASGGTAPYIGTGNFTALAGSYSFTVTDANGCSATQAINLSEPSALEVFVKAEPISNDQKATTVTVTANGGITPYTGTGNFTATEGQHSYTVTDANGCQASNSIMIANTQIAQLAATATQGSILCNGGTATVKVNATGGLAPYTGTGIYTVTAGTYTYTVKDALGNICNANITVAEPAPLNVSISSNADDGACKGLSSAITVNVTGGTTPYQYNLNAGNYQLSNEFNNLADGSYTVIVKDSNGCISSVPTVVTKSAPMKAWFSEVTDVSACGFADGSGTVINQGGIGPFEYSINNEDFQSGNVFTKLPENEYTVVVKDSRGCETSASTNIRRNSQLALEVSSLIPVSSCKNSNGEIKVMASGGGGAYQFCVNGQPFKGSSTFTDLSVGQYTITVKDWRGCTKSINVDMTKLPPLVAQVQSITNAGACENDGAITLGFSGGSGPYLFCINGGVSQSSNVFNNLPAGIYTVQVRDSRNCIASAIATIGKASEMHLKADTTAISCKGGSDGTITITTIGGVAPYQYSIDGKPFITRNIFGNVKAGIHTITVTDSKACIATIDVKMMPGTEDCSNSGPDLSIVFNPNDSLFKAMILPNPSPSAFTLITNGNSTERIDILVVDMTGKVVYKTSGSASQQYRFGSDFASGMYIVRILKGVHIENIKIIKTTSQ